MCKYVHVCLCACVMCVYMCVCVYLYVHVCVLHLEVRETLLTSFSITYDLIALRQGPSLSWKFVIFSARKKALRIGQSVPLLDISCSR